MKNNTTIIPRTKQRINPSKALPELPSVFSHQGGVVQFHQLHEEKKIGGLRGDVLPYCSAASRRRLAESMARIPWTQLQGQVWFVTLTLSPHYWHSPDRVKRGLDRFEDRLDYSYADAGYLGGWWRREIGQTDNMHYHLLIVGPDVEWSEFRSWCQRSWSECMEYHLVSDRKTEYLRVDVQRPENTVNVARYLGKYISKAAWEQYDKALKSNKNPDTDACVCSEERGCEPSGHVSVADNAPKALSKVHMRGNPNGAYQTSENNVEKWGKHWGIWRKSRLPYGYLSIVADWEYPENELWRRANAVKRTFRKWLEREYLYSQYRQLCSQYRQLCGISANHSEFRNYKPELLCEVAKYLKNERRRQRKDGEKLPYYETLRLNSGGYSLIMSENLKARLLLWAFPAQDMPPSMNHAN